MRVHVQQQSPSVSQVVEGTHLQKYDKKSAKEWEEVFEKFPVHLHWLVTDVTRPLMSGLIPDYPIHCSKAQQYTWARVLKTALAFGPAKYVRCYHSYGAIGDGRPTSSSSSPEDEIPLSPPTLTYRELVANSVPDLVEQEPSVLLLPPGLEELFSAPLNRPGDGCELCSHYMNGHCPASSDFIKRVAYLRKCLIQVLLAKGILF
ncbi:hypothetical protein NXS19_010152 [Fusarium pseudograminearum]|uniref:Uncharacterized protein n=1 Tax=Fusarium pseudograminearum (strain CS3096) TaxID=1028729 RepID=K3V130_FUSPC|nr:hypothetical protein FPSE_01009 [Fusarium pseudograminearum CS3096]EKJ78866.1 hypothetical protein FPSE_01009 [Fusarium pseudograminearum CS3096]KAF0636504.1 hypothetical protein FPSE5266_01009 [Fusarium pseudograminearum]UZP42336.1 hypothetical protein NXS19_010152 [Fusarium pseudograminearum]